MKLRIMYGGGGLISMSVNILRERAKEKGYKKNK
jgi:hypothetical protein